tara:strand:+ start:858 stop:1418 length:561 start_codon:yes stop_codon:yes gene_type:complete
MGQKQKTKRNKKQKTKRNQMRMKLRNDKIRSIKKQSLNQNLARDYNKTNSDIHILKKVGSLIDDIYELLPSIYLLSNTLEDKSIAHHITSNTSIINKVINSIGINNIIDNTEDKLLDPKYFVRESNKKPLKPERYNNHNYNIKSIEKIRNKKTNNLLSEGTRFFSDRPNYTINTNTQSVSSQPNSY